MAEKVDKLNEMIQKLAEDEELLTKTAEEIFDKMSEAEQLVMGVLLHKVAEEAAAAAAFNGFSYGYLAKEAEENGQLELLEDLIKNATEEEAEVLANLINRLASEGEEEAEEEEKEETEKKAEETDEDENIDEVMKELAKLIKGKKE